MPRGMEFFANGLVFFSPSLLKVNILENDIFFVQKPEKLNEVASYYSNFDLQKKNTIYETSWMSLRFALYI